jgi:hypothetical protein
MIVAVSAEAEARREPRSMSARFPPILRSWRPVAPSPGRITQELTPMPITRSEVVFLATGIAVGAAARTAYPRLKEKLGPLLAGAGAAVGDAYTEAARRVAEKVESVQDAMAERQQPAPSGSEANAA